MLATHWNCCSLSISGQLQRATPSPSPKLVPEAPEPLVPSMSNSPNPEVKLSPRFAFGMPKFVIALVPASGLSVTGLYLKYPKRKSPNNDELNVLVTPVAKL